MSKSKTVAKKANVKQASAKEVNAVLSKSVSAPVKPATHPDDLEIFGKVIRAELWAPAGEVLARVYHASAGDITCQVFRSQSETGWRFLYNTLSGENRSFEYETKEVARDRLQEAVRLHLAKCVRQAGGRVTYGAA
jgi:hypothetical protein